jgi:hypothetical protein
MSKDSVDPPPHGCEEMLKFLEDPDIPLAYWGKYREYGLRILDGGSAIQRIHYCPWCGQELPSSLRREWFDALEWLGLNPGDPNIPHSFRSGAWWRADGANE